MTREELEVKIQAMYKEKKVHEEAMARRIKRMEVLKFLLQWNLLIWYTVALIFLTQEAEAEVLRLKIKLESLEEDVIEKLLGTLKGKVRPITQSWFPTMLNTHDYTCSPYFSPYIVNLLTVVPDNITFEYF